MVDPSSTVEERRFSAASDATIIRGFSPSPQRAAMPLFTNTLHLRMNTHSGTQFMPPPPPGPPNRVLLIRI
jgi:hypothetical protein